METEKEEKAVGVKPVALTEDGQTFLSVRELDEYRTQKVMLAWQAGSYA